MHKKRTKYRLLKWLSGFALVIALLWVLFRISTSVRTPPAVKGELEFTSRVELGENIYAYQDCWLKKNPYGLWEMYLEGSDLQLGIRNGVLARDLIRSQEVVFIERLREMVPSDSYLKFLKQVIVWMNRNLDEYIPLEYQREILGVSQHASDSFSFIGPAYQRMLSYHAAHDIGHALQNMNLVACTALGVNGERSGDGQLLVGRNFDFSMGDKFSRDKIVAFYRPENGYKFAYITWGGMIGVVSGMNDQGLVVTLNAAKSGIPGSSKTPVSILARQILQYASNIQEAYELAGKAETFVAESFLISSAADNRTVVIEKSPSDMALFDTEEDYLILSNHFQSEKFRSTELTQKNIKEGASMYRWERTRELMEAGKIHDPHSFALLLRDQNGKEGRSIGMGNEKAINQLIAHHSVIFQPASLKMWVSTSPYQLGSFLCYDLNSVFADSTGPTQKIWVENECIGPDPFLDSEHFRSFKTYQSETTRLKALINREEAGGIAHSEIMDYLSLNPEYYYPWYIAGELLRVKGDKQGALDYYQKALSLEIPRKVDRDQVMEAMAEIEK